MQSDHCSFCGCAFISLALNFVVKLFFFLMEEMHAMVKMMLKKRILYFPKHSKCAFWFCFSSFICFRHYLPMTLYEK